MSTHTFSYNAKRPNLIISEYGRHIQNLVAHVKTVEDKEQRQNLAETIISLMHQKVDKQKSESEQLDTLWKHFFRIANYDIDVEVPKGIKIIRPEEKELDSLEYPVQNKKYRHYGSLVQKLIEKVSAMEDGPKKEEAISLIVSYMKMAYRTWNKEHFVNDDMIRGDLKVISKNKLEAGEDVNMHYLMGKKKRGGQGQSQNHHHNNQNNQNHKKRKTRKRKTR